MGTRRSPRSLSISWLKLPFKSTSSTPSPSPSPSPRPGSPVSLSRPSDVDHFESFSSDFSGFPVTIDFKSVSKIFLPAQRCFLVDEVPEFRINRRQCLLLQRVLASLHHCTEDLRKVFEILSVGASTPSSPRRSDGKSLSDVKRDLAEIDRLKRISKDLLWDCCHKVCSAVAIKRLDDTKAFEAILTEMEVWWQDLTLILERILSDLGNRSGFVTSGGSLPGFSGALWRYLLHVAATKDREEALQVLQKLVWQHTNLTADQWHALTPTQIHDFHRARLLSGKLMYLPIGNNCLTTTDALYVDPSNLEVGKHLGSGAHGKVHQVVWCGENYAMKTFKVRDTNAFHEEIFIHARLQHPHIVKLICHSRDETDNTCSLIMELMDQNLSSLIHKSKNSPHRAGTGPFKPLVAVRILLQIASAMDYLHQQDIMHRDLKAENILVNCGPSPNPTVLGDFHVKVADFDMAKSKASSSEFNTAMIGTPYWRAPEVSLVTDESQWTSRYTSKADVYSFACTSYEVVTGEIPLAHYNGRGLIERIRKGERPHIPDSVHPPLAAIIKACWHNEARMRLSFEEICNSLHKCLVDLSGYEWI